MRETFEFQRLIQHKRPFINEDFIFNPQDFHDLNEFVTTQEELDFNKEFLAFTRVHFLDHAKRPDISCEIRITLCWNGFADALNLLFMSAESFERPVSIGSVRHFETLGDFSLGWSWSGDEEGADITLLVRYNVLCVVQGFRMGKEILSIAHAIDRTIRDLKTAERYLDDDAGVFSRLKGPEGEVPSISTGDTFSFGKLPDEDMSYYFVTEQGSVNRDQYEKGRWYFRAGSRSGQYLIHLYKVGSGILPIRETMQIQAI